MHIYPCICLSVWPWPCACARLQERAARWFPPDPQDRGTFTRGRAAWAKQGPQGPQRWAHRLQLSTEKQGCEPPASASTVQAPCPVTHHQNSSPILGKMSWAPGARTES